MADEAWTKDEVNRMKKKAYNFISDSDWANLNYITRDQEEDYFDEIMYGNNGIMETEEKDCYGSPQNPINEKLYGLWFSACVDWTRTPTQPFDKSLYGPKRLQLRATELITPDKRIYFTDFYCMSSSQSERHYIQLVLCTPGSDADQFCQRRLPQLDIEDNPILHLENGRAWVTKGAYVQIFYTEQMDISKKKLKDVEWMYKSRNPDPQKNFQCKYCNLEAKRRKRGRAEEEEQKKKRKRVQEQEELDFLFF